MDAARRIPTSDATERLHLLTRGKRKRAASSAAHGSIDGEGVPACVALQHIFRLLKNKLPRAGKKMERNEAVRDVLKWLNGHCLDDGLNVEMTRAAAANELTVNEILIFDNYLHGASGDVATAKILKYPANVCAAISAAWRELAARCYMLIGAWAAVRNQLRGGFHVVQCETEEKSPYNMTLGELKSAVPKEVRDTLFGPGPDEPDGFCFSTERRAVAIEIIEAVRAGKCKNISNAIAFISSHLPSKGLSAEMIDAYFEMTDKQLRRWTEANKLDYSPRELARLPQEKWEKIKAFVK